MFDLANPKTNDFLVVQALNVVDADGDSPISYKYDWSVNGNFAYSHTWYNDYGYIDLSQAGLGDKGDVISVSVTPSDANDIGTPVTISTTVGNSAPVIDASNLASLQSYTTASIALQINATDADGDAIVYSATGLSALGLSIDSTGLITGTIPANADTSNPYVVSVTASDGSLSQTVAFNWTLVPNTLSLANPGNLSFYHNVGVAYYLQGTSTENHQLSYSIDSATPLPPGLTLLNSDTGLIGGMMDRSAVSPTPYTITATVHDAAAGLSATQTFTITVLNHAPTIGSLAFDNNDPKTNDTLIVQVVNPADADAVDSAVITYTYVWTVAGDTVQTTTTTSLTDSLDLSISGYGDKGQVIAVSVTPSDLVEAGPAVTAAVTVGNTAPIATSHTYYTAYNSPFDFDLLENALDADGDVLVATIVGPTNGTLSPNLDGSYTYTPNLNTSGVDSFTFTVFDGSANSLTETITIVVGAAPAITAVSDAFETLHDTPLSIDISAFLANDSSTSATFTGFDQPQNGTVTTGPTGTIVYTPNAGFAGWDVFNYTIALGSDTATAQVEIEVKNQFPDTPARYFDIDPDTTLTVTAPAVPTSDSDGDPLSITLDAGPSYAQAFTWNANGSFAYTPTVGFSGTDFLSYNVSDGVQSSTVVVVLQVGPVLGPPQAASQFAVQYRNWIASTAATGGLTRARVDTLVLTRPDVQIITGESAAAIATIKQYFNQLATLGGQPNLLRRQDAVAFEELLFRATVVAGNPLLPLTATHRLVLDIEAAYLRNLASINGVNRNLYGTSTAPNAQAVRQGATNDCAFLSAIIAMVNASQQPGYDVNGPTVQSMISPVYAGTVVLRYNVTFPGQAVIQVLPPTDAELALYSNAGANGIWINVLEKAYCQLRANPFATFLGLGNTIAQDNIGIGETLSASMQLLTRNRSEVFSLSAPAPTSFTTQIGSALRGAFGGAVPPGRFLSTYRQVNLPANHMGLMTLRTRLDDALSNGRLVTVSTNEAPRGLTNLTFPAAGQPNFGILPGPHAYAIVGSRVVDGVTRYMIQNPHNNTTESPAFGGRFEVDINFIAFNFLIISFQTAVAR